MNAKPPIPETHLALITCLRCALHDAPADPSLRQADWAGLLRQAQEHGVHTFLYPWLAKRLPDLFPSKTPESVDAAPAAWRQLFLLALTHTVQRQRQLAELFSAFNRAKLDVVPLKGAWLCQTVYDDPAQRTMSDIDLLVREEERDACHAVFLSCGYTVKKASLHNAFARDQSYYHANCPWAIELHWHFASEMTHVVPPPDLADIWANTLPSTCCGQPVRQLALEDCVALLTYHLLNHLFALPLRAYLDLALLLKAFGDRLSPERLAAASARWKTRHSTQFLLRLTADLFAFPLSPALDAYAGATAATRLAQASQALFNLPAARAREGELTLLQYKNASLLNRLRLIANRIFMPQAFLMLHYPCARHRAGLPLAWLLRGTFLIRNKSSKIKSMFDKGSADAQLLADAENRESLVRWLLTETDEPA
jgi:hypothetical protein